MKFWYLQQAFGKISVIRMYIPNLNHRVYLKTGRVAISYQIHLQF